MYCIIKIEKVRCLINGSSVDMFYILHLKWCVCVCVCVCVLTFHPTIDIYVGDVTPKTRGQQQTELFL